VGNDTRMDNVAAIIRSIRRVSRNRSVVISGPPLVTKAVARAEQICLNQAVNYG
jgi:hypothetical protein